VGRYRSAICALLFAATAINYVDRQIIGVLKPTLQLEFGWSESAFGDVIFWFTAADALGYMAFGRLIDKIGVRLGYAAVVIFWTAAHMAHALVGCIGGFVAVRFALGLGESGSFAASLKAIAEWFPKRERALATGGQVRRLGIGQCRQLCTDLCRSGGSLLACAGHDPTAIAADGHGGAGRPQRVNDPWQAAVRRCSSF
jgi:MFS family permease